MGDTLDWLKEKFIGNDPERVAAYEKELEAARKEMTDQKKVDAWNRDNVTGRVVVVDMGFGTTRKTVTRSCAGMLGGHTPVVWLEGIRGAYHLDRVTPCDGVGDIPDADRAGGGATCPDCGRELRDHPADLEHLGKDGVPSLTRLCSGRVVKL